MTHICIEANPDIYDGYGLRLEIHDWLQDNIGPSASDMTDYKWSTKAAYYMKVSDSKVSPMYQTTGDRQSGGKYIHFLFKDPSKAMLFKLRWSGQ